MRATELSRGGSAWPSGLVYLRPTECGSTWGLAAISPNRNGKGCLRNRNNNELAERTIAVINRLRLTAAPHAGEPFRLRPWQEEIVRAYCDPIVRTVFVGMPRKNAKTQLSAALVVDALAACPDRESETYSAASTRYQAATLFKAAASMIRSDGELTRRVTIRDSRKWMRNPRTMAEYQALSSDSGGAHGLRPTRVFADELHAWRGGGHDLWDALTTGSDVRAQPKVVCITTAGRETNSKCRELWTYAQNVRDGIIDDPTFAPFLWEAAPDCDPFDETIWHACNPALGDFKKIEGLRALAKRARTIPSDLDALKQLHLNIWIQSASKWLRVEDWAAGNAPLPDLAGKPCYAGLDLSATTDTTALVLAFPPALPGAPWHLLPEIFLPAEGLDRKASTDKAPYRQFVEQGYLTLTPGAAIDQDYIFARLIEAHRTYDVRGVAYDRALAGVIRNRLEEAGCRPVQFGQGYASMSPAAKEFQRLVVEGKLRHGGHQLLAYQASQVVVDRDAADNIKPTKSKSTDRIDGIVAAIMAVGLATIEAAEPKPQPSVYENRGLIVF